MQLGAPPSPGHSANTYSTVVMAGMDGKANSSYSGPRGQVRFAAPSGPEEQGYLWASGGLSYGYRLTVFVTPWRLVQAKIG
jgi:hypothetical protein